MTTKRYEYPAVSAALKRAMKKKKISYRDLGARVGLSESGVKKIMTGEDVSLSRLGDICDAVNVDVLQLLEVAWRLPAAPIVFTPEQENFFAANPAHHAFLYALLSFHFDVEAVMSDFDLDRRSADAYVGGLESAGFVHVTDDGCVEPTFGPDAHWFRYRSPSSCDRQVEALRSALAGPASGRCIRTGRVRMTQKHYDEMNQEILDLLLRWQVMSTQDELYVDDDNLVDIWVLAATAKQKMSDVTKIPRIASAAEPP